MIDNENLRQTVVQGLRAYMGIPVIRGNQNATPPAYPYATYNVTTQTSQNKGTWQQDTDGIDRKAVTQTWSISVQSDDEGESTLYAGKAREWLDHVGTLTMSDNNVIVQSVGNITDRSNIITAEYEYKRGFDVVFWCYDEVTTTRESGGVIDTAELTRIQT